MTANLKRMLRESGLPTYEYQVYSVWKSDRQKHFSASKWFGTRVVEGTGSSKKEIQKYTPTLTEYQQFLTDKEIATLVSYAGKIIVEGSNRNYEPKAGVDKDTKALNQLLESGVITQKVYEASLKAIQEKQEQRELALP